MATLQFMSKRVYIFVCYRLELPVNSWGGGRGLRTTRAWRVPCLPSSRFSELHRGSGTPQLRAGGTRGANGRCLSSSLHNRFITFYRKTPATSSVSTKKRVFSGLGHGQWARECNFSRKPQPIGSRPIQLQPNTPKVIWLTIPCPDSASVNTPTTKPIMATRPLRSSARSKRSLRI